MLVLAGDIGGTKTNLALFKASGAKIDLMDEISCHTTDFLNLNELLTSYLKKNSFEPNKICLGVAGPVLNGHSKLSNLGWVINKNELSNYFKKSISIINDLEATAYGLAMIKDSEILTVQEGKEKVAGNAVVIAPGTGLGEAGIFWDGNNFMPFATEGGHADFAVRNDLEFKLYLFLQKQFGHVSWERVLSGPGIIQMYQFLVQELKREESQEIKNLFESGYDAAIISQNVQNCPVCKETMSMFVRFLAYESANLVLKHNATGGLFIGGGIVPSILNLLEEYNFKEYLCQSGRLNELIEKVSVKVILNKKAALLGAAWYAVNRD